MVAAAPNLDRFLWLSLVMGAVLWCGPWAGRHVAANDDDFDDFTDEDFPAITRRPAPPPGDIPQPVRPVAVTIFNQTVFGAQGTERDGSARQQLEQILHGRILAVDIMIGLTADQKRKLELAGSGDIKRLFDRIGELRTEFQHTDDQAARKFPAGIAQKANELRGAFDSGPFDENSVFLKLLRHHLHSDQRPLYESYRELERIGGKIHLRQCRECEIKAIRMADAALDDDGMRHFSQLNGLEGVLLEYTQVTDKGLVHLAGLTNLALLDLGSTQVRGPGLVHLQNMHGLQVFDLRRTPITDAALTHLRNLTELKTLNLGHTRVTGTGFAQLTTLQHLETLLLHQTPFTNEGLSHLRDLARLKELFLDGTQIDDAGLSHLARLTNLTKLSVRRTGVTDAGVANLAGLTNLRTLDLYDTDVTAAAIDKLKKALPDLTVVK
jgi:hypothetical protein